MPIAHSLSPAVHNAAFSHLGLDWVYVAFAVDRGGGGGAVAAMRTLGLGGLSVTMPLKAEVAAAVDGLADEARRLGAANAVVRDGDRLIGHSTDGQGFLDALRHDAGFDPGGRRCVVIGAGGAGRAAILALARAGASEVVVVNRSPERAAQAAALAGGVRVGTIADAADGDLVVNATPIGMTSGGLAPGSGPDDPTGGPWWAAERMGPGQLFVELSYDPAVTPQMALAASRGVSVLGGVGMLVHQAARALALWTGLDPPVKVMRAAAEAELARRGADTAGPPAW